MLLWHKLQIIVLFRRFDICKKIKLLLFFFISDRVLGVSDLISCVKGNQCTYFCCFFHLVDFYILNKSENATPELFAIYIQNYANQECN